MHSKSIQLLAIKHYDNAETMKSIIYKENKNKSGIYCWINNITGDFYIGQSINLYARFTRYFSPAYIQDCSNLIISRAITKYGYSNFSVIILEYCDKSLLTEIEQFYLSKFNPIYNILKIAGSSKGFKHSQKTNLQISEALKGKFVGINSLIFGKIDTEETKKLMSLQIKGENNSLFGKNHSGPYFAYGAGDKAKILMRNAALGRIQSAKTKMLISIKLGFSINLFEKQFNNELVLISSFSSYRKAA